MRVKNSCQSCCISLPFWWLKVIEKLWLFLAPSVSALDYRQPLAVRSFRLLQPQHLRANSRGHQLPRSTFNPQCCFPVSTLPVPYRVHVLHFRQDCAGLPALGEGAAQSGGGNTPKSPDILFPLAASGHTHCSENTGAGTVKVIPLLVATPQRTLSNSFLIT